MKNKFGRRIGAVVLLLAGLVILFLLYKERMETRLTFDGEEIAIEGEGACRYDSDVIISKGGEYILSGNYTGGTIRIQAGDTSLVKLVLQNVNIQCEAAPAIEVEEAGAVQLILTDGTENTLSSASESVIETKAPLSIQGEGRLSVQGSGQHGIKADGSFAIEGGELTITATQDAIHGKEDFSLEGGNITIEAGDDAVHVEESIVVNNGKLEILSCYEGLESKNIEINGGEITIYPTDDGINATDGSGSGDSFMPDGHNQFEAFESGNPQDENSNQIKEHAFRPENMQGEPPARKDKDALAPGMPKRENNDRQKQMPKLETDQTDTTDLPSVHITGGKLTIINVEGRDADGIDSNGNIVIDGGDIQVFLLGEGPNNAIDFGSESGGICQINGGTVIACGSTSMMETPDTSSAQKSVVYTNESGLEEGETISLQDASGETLLETTLPCKVTALIFSCPKLKTTEKYTLVKGDTVEKVEVQL